MRAIYKPTGRAREYAEWAVNLYSSCTHGCLYCYAPQVLHMDRAAFHAECIERPDILQKLRHDARILQGTITDPVLLCFTCDAYQPGEHATRAALSILREFDIPFTVLTKGVYANRDFDLYGPRDSFGVTLTLINRGDLDTWEPHAASAMRRIWLLREAHARGIRTWVSFEPVIDPAQTLRLIDATHEFVDVAQKFVDHYKVGKLNYHPLAKTIDWAKFLRDVTAELDGYGADYYIKRDLAEAAA